MTLPWIIYMVTAVSVAPVLIGRRAEATRRKIAAYLWMFDESRGAKEQQPHRLKLWALLLAVLLSTEVCLCLG